VIVIFVLLLPFFGQFFSYMKDVLPLWALAKAFPLLSLPLALILLRHPQFPMTRQILFSFFWLVLVPTALSINYFQQDFFVGLGAQVKLLPILFFFSFLGLMLLVEPTLKELTAAFLICGLVTFAAVLIIWALAPDSAYSTRYVVGTSPLLTSDHRGHRIRMPMYFGIIATFYAYRRFLASGQIRWLITSLFGLGLTLGLVKTRAMIVGIAGVFAIRGFLAASGWMKIVVALIAPLALSGLFSFGYLSTLFSTDRAAGIDTRLKTIAAAMNFLGNDSWRWIFGVGTISPTSSDSLFAYFDHFFFLADITWLGVVFEYGIVGSLIFLLFELRGIWFSFRLSKRVDSAFLGALTDYLIYVLLISSLYPLTLTPGETSVILAIFVYVWQWLEGHSGDEIEMV